MSNPAVCVHIYVFIIIILMCTVPGLGGMLGGADWACWTLFSPFSSSDQIKSVKKRTSISCVYLLVNVQYMFDIWNNYYTAKKVTYTKWVSKTKAKKKKSQIERWKCFCTYRCFSHIVPQCWEDSKLRQFCQLNSRSHHVAWHRGPAAKLKFYPTRPQNTSAEVICLWWLSYLH